MPINDVVSPIIKAFLAGQDQKMQRERAVQQKQAADDESKLRQLNAQRIQKELDAFDARNKAEMDANFIQKKQAIANGVMSGAIPVEYVDKISAALKGEEPNIPGAIGLTGQLQQPVVNLPSGQESVNDIPALREIRAQNIAAETNAKLPGVIAQEAIKTDFGIKRDAAKVEAQTKATEAARTANQTFTADQKEKDRLLAERLAQQRISAQAALARLHESQSNARTVAKINAGKPQANPADVQSLIKEGFLTNLVSRNSLTAYDAPIRKEIMRQATMENVKLHTDADLKSLSEIKQFNSLISDMENLSKEVGSQAPSTLLGGFSTIGKQVAALDAYRPFIAKMSSVKGAQSDRDTALMGGRLLTTTGLNVAKENQKRIEAIKRLKGRVFMQYFPKGTNEIQVANAMDAFGVSEEDIKLAEQADAAATAKANGGKK